MNTSTELLKAKAHHQKKEFEAAKQLYEAILSVTSSEVEALHGLGMIAIEEKNYSAAIEWLAKAIQEKPDDEKLHHHQALAYQGAEKFDAAISAYKKAIQYNPHYAEAHNNYANLLKKMGNKEAALKHYVCALHIHPAYVTAHYNAGLLLLEEGNQAAAIKQFNNVIRLNPTMVSAHLKLGDLYLQAEKLKKAKKQYEMVLQLMPTEASAYNNLGVIAVKKKEAQKAVDYFSKALAYDEHFSEARNNLAAIFLHHCRYENAMTHYEILLQEKPKDIEVQYNLGVAYLGLAHLDKAENCFLKIIEQDKTHVDSLCNLAAIYCRRAQKEKALAYYQTAQQFKKDDPIIEYMLAVLQGKDTIQQAPEQYITHLFDQYAVRFEEQVKQLAYQAPAFIREIIETKITAKENAWRILDLGCGTGLCGAEIKSFANHLVGVDLSEKMVEEARKKEIYDALHVMSIAAFFKKFPTEKYDLMVVADVFCYSGNLQTIFQQCRKHLTTKGYFIFTVEQSEQYPFVLKNTARFAHHEQYIQELAQQTEFISVVQNAVSYRKQEGQPVASWLFVFQRS